MECLESLNVNISLDNIFQKQFHFQNSVQDLWTLGNQQNKEDHSKNIEQLLSLKENLNAVKSSLNDFDIREWSSHTNFTNPCSKVLFRLRNAIHPELGTQAWCKFYELLSYGDVVPTLAKNICSVHLCEAPGGFICALNHYIKTTLKGVGHSWVANSLNPYYEGNTLDSCIVDDRLISRTLRSWCFGDDNTGDVLCVGFLKTLQSNCLKSFHGKAVNLVTADGSLNCQHNPSQQEAIVAPLHYTELLCALSILSPGGNFVVKMFTLFEEHSISFMYMLCCMFKTVSVFKPATSKAGNSEVYVVARQYCGLEVCLDLVEQLKSFFPFNEFIQRKFPFMSTVNIPASYLSQHLACVKLFTEYQIATIQNNIRLFHNISEQLETEILTMHDVVTQRFFDHCNLKKLPPKQCIVPSGVLRYKVKSNLQLRPRLEGSFTQREKTEIETEMLTTENDDIACWLSFDLTWIPKMPKQFWWNTTQAIVGKPIADIHSSLFCGTSVIVQFEHAFEQLTQKKKRLPFAEATGTISNPDILECLSSMLARLNGGFVNVVIDNSDLFHSSWMRNIISIANPALKCLDIPCFESISDMRISKTNLLICNFVLSCQEALKWCELKIRFLLVKTIFYAKNCLRKGAMCCFVLPSVLMRLTAQILWIFSQCFEEVLLYPVKSETPNSFPAVLFVGQKFQMVGSYIPHLRHLCNIVSSSDYDLLELFPITALLHTDHAAWFIDALRFANEKCLVEATVVLNNEAMHLPRD